jgi:hypothetical protein
MQSEERKQLRAMPGTQPADGRRKVSMRSDRLPVAYALPAIQGIVAAFVATLLMALCVSSAQAASKFTDSIIGTTASGSTGGLFSSPQDIAVSTAAGHVGEVYVVEASNNRISRFGADGAFQRAWGLNVVTAPVNEVQRVTVAATAGTYTLTFGGATTGNLAFNATASTVQTALRALSTVGGSNLTVTGGPGNAAGSAPYVITFTTALAATDVPELTADAALLTGTATPSTTTPGSGAFEVCTSAPSCRAGTASGAPNATDTNKNGALNSPQGIAIDQDTGHVYVTDRGNFRVNQYTADGTFVRSFAHDVNATTPGTGFEVCQAADRCKAATTGASPGQFGNNTQSWRLDVSKDGNPANGFIAVADPGNTRVQLFDLTDLTSSTPPSATDGEIFGSSAEFATGSFARPIYVAVAPNGIVYAANSSSTTHAIYRWDTNTDAYVSGGPITGSPVDPLPSGAIAGGSTGIQGLEIDPFNGHLLVVRNPGDPTTADTVILEFASPAGVPTLADVHLVGSGNASINGIGLVHTASSDRLYVSTGNQVFMLDADGANPLPVAVPGQPIDVEAHSATIRGTVNPNGTPFATSYRFELSTNGITWTPVAADVNLGNAVGDQVVSQSATGLVANKLYRVRLITTRSGLLGSAGRSESPELTFLTDAPAPTVQTLAPVNRTATGALLQASINPEGSPTTYRFEYLTEQQFAASGWADATRAPVPDASSGSAGTASRFTQQVDGLQPNTDYRYRITASNGQEGDPVGNPGDTTQEGAAVLFSTRPQFTAADGRAYELVSPALKPVNDVGRHAGSSALDRENEMSAGLVSDEGSRAMFYSDAGVLASGAATFVYDHSISERTNVGWVSRSAFTRRNYAENQLAPFLTMFATDSGLSTFMWRQYGGAYGVNLFEGMLGAGYDPVDKNVSYLSDSAGSWEFYGPEQSPEGDTTQPRSATPAAVSADGRHAVMTSSLIGTAGLGDPSRNRPDYDWNQLPGAWSTYVHDAASGGLSDTFPGAGVKSNVAACDAGTLIPEINDNGTDAGPAGNYNVFASYGSGSTTVTLAFFFGGNAPQVGQTVASSQPGIPAGTRIVSTAPGAPGAGWSFEISQPTTAAGTNASVSGGQDAVAAADDFVDTQACPPAASGADAAQVSRRGSSLGGAGMGGSNSLASESPRDLSLKNVISADGSRVFFQSPDARDGTSPPLVSCATTRGLQTDCPPQLFVRQRNDDGDVAVRWLSQSEALLGGSSSLLGPAYFEGASADGDVVFFRTTSPLTADDPNAGSASSAQATSWDLYMYDLPDGDDPADGGELTRVSAGPSGTGDCNVVQQFGTDQLGAKSPGGDGGALRFASDQGDRVYFTCNASLPGVPGAGSGTITAQGGAVNQPATTGTTNLYMYENDGSSEDWTFITQLPRASTNSEMLASCATTNTQAGEPRQARAGSGDFKLSVGRGTSGSNCVRGTPDGSFITFWTDGRLVADDPDAASGDMYAFDAAADELVRVSAPQGGEGTPYLCVSSTSTQCYGDPGYHSLSGPTAQARSQLGVVTDPAISGDRTVFFQSKARLVPEDVNAMMDVYQWRNGELSLISTGTSEYPAIYSGNSADGRDVFLVTQEKLSWQDVDMRRDMYNVRVGGGFAEPVVPVSCAVLAGACQQAGSGAPSAVAGETANALGDGDAAMPARASVRAARLTKGQLTSLRRGNEASLRVTINQPGKLTIRGTSRIAKHRRQVISATRTSSSAGEVLVPITLSRRARVALARTGRLRVRLSVALSGANQPVTSTLAFTRPKTRRVRKLDARRATVPAGTNRKGR